MLAPTLRAQPSTSTPAPSTASSKPSKKAAPSAGKFRLDEGSVSNGVYHNPGFGFSYKLPFGWVERTAEMRQDGADPTKSQLLLAVFERPPEAVGETVNSAVIIAAESVSSYPGLKTAADYFGPLTELTTSKGFKVVNEPYEVLVGAKSLVRGDFSKELGKVTMRQSSLVMVAKGYIVSFTFIGGSEDEVEQLVEKLSFPVAIVGKPPKSK